MDTKRKKDNMKALAAALILSEHCQYYEACDNSIFGLDIEETLPCALLRSGTPENWDLHVLRELKEAENEHTR